ncbi:hypothetical protein DBR43_31695 [Pedobacter sp. KBW06]|uniref:hypothetical protein n=1 Tax=Pedobacter sp. KBW06 TaxID=2153359 RepID=UPI000F59DF36|nr:hypothetical protein [Pedobacter sp. KBW06]RQO64845.1 hypothetical protein DBR43_31695 [Pedobacter sp. KBW06]
MQKQYLTAELIEWVQKEAKDPIWQMGVLASFSKQWYGVFSVSSARLIFIHGNRDTGWQHIMSRHNYYSNDLYFGEGALGDPSRFQSVSIPIDDWRQVADDVFLRGAKDLKVHADGALFEKYMGTSSRFSRSGGEARDFVLVLYRNTMIVHSLFPKRSLQPDVPKSKLKKFKRALDEVTAGQFSSEFLTIRIPYFNEELTERYVVIVHIDLSTMGNLAHLQVNWPNGQPYYCIYKLMDFKLELSRSDVAPGNIEFTRFLNTFSKYADFSHIEKIMMSTEQHHFLDA